MVFWPLSPFLTTQTPRPVYKPRSVHSRRRWAVISLGHRSPGGSSGLPGTLGRAALTPKGWSLLGLAPGGGCLAGALLRSPVVSYTTISPLPHPRRYVSVALSGTLRRPGCYPAPCPVERGLSSTLYQGRDRPTDLGIFIIPHLAQEESISCRAGNL
ncbi:hypothetical protein ATHL_02691 [Anaerolinea thermolimosa]|nr:hypothetical protein ATHL_02691 [Anaerolinea thermolimosa]